MDSRHDSVKVSVIVPVYNVEKYILECIASLKSQTLKEIQFILVDDGSTDNSYELIKKSIRSDERFLLVHQTNSGAGKARNKGISFATGEYIGFVDSDDFIDSTYYQKMYESAKKYNSDMVMLGCIKTTLGSTISLSFPGSPYSLETLSKISFNCIDYPYILENVFLWNRIIKRELWLNNKLIVPENRVFAEDLLICTQMTVLSDRISCITEPLYTYRTDVPTSLSKKLSNSVKKTDFIVAVHETFQYINSLDYKDVLYKDIVTFTTQIFILQLKTRFSKADFYHFFYSYLNELDDNLLSLLRTTWINERYPEIILAFDLKNPLKCYRKNKICNLLHLQ